MKVYGKGGGVEMEFDFYYGLQSQTFSFYRIPKLLFTDPRFSSLSAEAKTLYGILLDRMDLSMKNGWLDKKNRVYSAKVMKKRSRPSVLAQLQKFKALAAEIPRKVREKIQERGR